MDKQRLGLVLKHLEEDIMALERKWKREGLVPWWLRQRVAKLMGREEEEFAGPVNYDLTLINGICGKLEGLVTLYICGGDRVQTYDSKPSTPTVEEGLQEIFAQMQAGLGRGSLDLSAVPIEAFGELMQELAEIAMAMSPPGVKLEVGRLRGPDFLVHLGRDCLLSAFSAGLTSAEITFREVGEQFSDFDPSDWGARNCHFKATGKTTLDALEVVVAQAQLRAKGSPP